MDLKLICTFSSKEEIISSFKRNEAQALDRHGHKSRKKNKVSPKIQKRAETSKNCSGNCGEISYKQQVETNSGYQWNSEFKKSLPSNMGVTGGAIDLKCTEKLDKQISQYRTIYFLVSIHINLICSHIMGEAFVILYFIKMAPYYSNHFVAVNERYCKSLLLSAMEQILESMMGFERGAGNVLANS